MTQTMQEIEWILFTLLRNMLCCKKERVEVERRYILTSFTAWKELQHSILFFIEKNNFKQSYS